MKVTAATADGGHPPGSSVRPTGLLIEARPDGSLLLTQAIGPRWGFGVAGAVASLWLLNGVRSGEAGLLGAVVIVPLAVILLLAGLGAARHRDWMLFDRRAREIVFRRGLGSIFRPVSVVPFDEVEAILLAGAVESSEERAVHLLRAGEFVWPVQTAADPADARRLAAAIQAVGQWPVRETGGGSGE